eukprot:CAMPEP_0168174776 /NCGR_PEP_ID=MMETSP0139_2-20121125/6717_1 /TAXON_ID=44445 /ORGANISM="Pseudo-nitzschia australis, Strain 10249 10 AB" /LENGTH=267 /DNA_ID=CAMNT_0008093015 /DNA_START=237 /DNA_END=1040 /DNA_ORIENTATION=-
MATLRLSSSTSPTTNTIDGYLQQLTDDTSISLAQKNDCLKTLTVVLKNLIDPSKGGAKGEAGLKYRTLKLDNPKLRARLFCGSDSSCVRDLLKDPSLVGMATTTTTITIAAVGSNNSNSTSTGTLVMEEAPASSAVDIISMRVLPAIATAQSVLLAATQQQQQQQQQQHKKAKLTEHNTTSNTTSTSTSTSHAPPEKLSEKQKARLLLEEKKRLEKERDKLYRKQTRAQIKADKRVRLHDENWKPAVSAAADKSGTGLQSFRDRHGE